MAKKHRKSTMPAIIPNQPQYRVYWPYYGGDGEKFRTEADKNERNRRRLILSPERRPEFIEGQHNRRCLSLSKAKPRTATRTRNYPQVRTINN